MPWKLYRISAALASPLHSGWRSRGNVRHTRPYVTGRMFWGALTARLQRDLAIGSGYEQANTMVRESFAFGYGFFSDRRDGVSLWPWDQPGYFSWLFEGSYSSTALADGRSKLDGSLHETEYVAPRTREGKQVYLLAHLFVKEEFKAAWQDSLAHIRLGAERSYGWGRIREVQLSEQDGPSLFPATADLSGARPVLDFQKEGRLPAHLTTSKKLSSVDGPFETVVGRETCRSSGRFGALLSRPRFAYAPGSKITAPLSCSIADDGFLEVAS